MHTIITSPISLFVSLPKYQHRYLFFSSHSGIVSWRKWYYEHNTFDSGDVDIDSCDYATPRNNGRWACGSESKQEEIFKTKHHFSWRAGNGLWQRYILQCKIYSVFYGHDESQLLTLQTFGLLCSAFLQLFSLHIKNSKLCL